MPFCPCPPPLPPLTGQCRNSAAWQWWKLPCAVKALAQPKTRDPVTPCSATPARLRSRRCSYFLCWPTCLYLCHILQKEKSASKQINLFNQLFTLTSLGLYLGMLHIYNHTILVPPYEWRSRLKVVVCWWRSDSNKQGFDWLTSFLLKG